MYLGVTTSDGHVKVIRDNKVILSQKRNNLPTTCSAWYGTSHIFIGSADYTYNLVAIPQRESIVSWVLKSLVFLMLIQIPVALVIMMNLSP